MVNSKSYDQLKRDRAGIMLNVPPIMIAGYICIMVAMISYYLHIENLFQDTFMGDVWNLAPLLIAAGVGLIVSRFTPDPKIILGIGAVVAVAFYIFLVV